MALHALSPITQPEAPWSPSPTSVLVQLDPAPFSGEAEGFDVTVSTADGLRSTANLDASGRYELTWGAPVTDGTELLVSALARFRDP